MRRWLSVFRTGAFLPGVLSLIVCVALSDGWSAQKPAAAKPKAVRPQPVKQPANRAQAPKAKPAPDSEAETVQDQFKGRRASVEEQLGVSVKDERAKAKMRQIRAQRQQSMSSEQREEFDALSQQLSQLHGASDVTSEQKATLRDAIKKTLCGQQKPSEESVEKLCSNMAELVVEGGLSPDEALQIHQNVQCFVESDDFTDEQAEMVVLDTKAIVNSSRASCDAAESIVEDTQAIVLSAKRNKTAALKAEAIQSATP